MHGLSTGEHECEFCHRKFTTAGHLQTHHTLSGKACATKASAFNKGRKTGSSFEIRPVKKDTFFKKPISVVVPRAERSAKMSKRPGMCCYCGKSVQWLLLHERTCAFNDNRSPSLKTKGLMMEVVCKGCRRIFSKVSFRRHLQRCSKLGLGADERTEENCSSLLCIECAACKVTFTYAATALIHTKSCCKRSVESRCGRCGQLFGSGRGRVVHEKNYCGKNVFKMFSCGKCGQLFTTQDEAVAHYDSCASAAPNTKKPRKTIWLPQKPFVPDQAPAGMVACPTCKCTFGPRNKELLPLHLRYHSDPSSLTPEEAEWLLMSFCAKCDKWFTSAVTKARHDDTVHLKIKKYQCVFCNKRFTARATQRQHEQKVHTGQFVVTCDYCPATFQSKEKCAKHVESYHPQELRHECAVCGGRFITSNGLSKHLRTKHNM